MYRPDDVGNRASYTPPQSTQPPPQSNRFSQPSYNNSSFAGPQPYRPTSELMQQQHTPAQDPSMLADTELSSGNTPGVIGAQEVYRDPRSRIEAEQRSQKPKGEAGDRLSFRDKMKMFAAEAGENTPIQRPKLSKSQRALEESLAYGNGHIP
ncbi:cno [Bugula neritina]|uniref:Cno n=1 Tax=Bugula neritina TaxID=10212 RepID=A0A7J7KE64_BUGNE|nr:cno [Bugula neritina]